MVCKDAFLREPIGEIWVDFKFRDLFLSKHDFCSSMIWNNSLVRIANRPIFFKHWAEAAIKNIKDLVNDDLMVITWRDFRKTFCLCASFLEFYGVSSALRSAPVTLCQINTLLLSQWYRHSCRHPLTWDQQLNLFWTEIDICELILCLKLTLCSFLSDIDILTVTR